MRHRSRLTLIKNIYTNHCCLFMVATDICVTQMSIKVKSNIEHLL